MNKETYLNEVISLVKSKPAKRKIRRELENHIDDRIGFYLDSGFDEAAAEIKAMERMGNAEKLAEEMKKLYNNKHWIILSVISLLVFISGLITADCMITDYLIINIVDFVEVYGVPCVISVLTFLAFVLAYLFARKAESSKLLKVIGYFGVYSPLISIVALLPFGYQLVGVFTEFPAAIKLGESYFDYSEVFTKIYEALSYSDFGYFTKCSLIILVVLLLFSGVVVGVFAFISASAAESDETNIKTERRLKRFSAFSLVIALIAVLGTFAECIYDQTLYYKQEREHYENEPLYYQELKKEMNSISLPMTTQEILAFAEERGMSQYELLDLKYSELAVYANESGFIQLRDENKDGIYETKRLATLNCSAINKDEIKKLKEVSDLKELQDIINYSFLYEYYEIYEDSKVKINIESVDNKNDPVYVNLEFDRENNSK